MSNIIEYLQERGLIDQHTASYEAMREFFQQKRKFYLGIDPTASAMHLGNLVAVVFAMHFQRFGHQPVILVGGATGLIGDPSGKDTERLLLTEEVVESNVASIKKALGSFLNFEDKENGALLVNNYDWFSKMNVVSFLRDVGKQFRMGTMLGKESVRKRIQSEDGMSFTEFSYQLLQGYDFYYLYHNEGVVLQIGGSDQYGNICAGIDFVRRVTGESVYGLTFPLLTRSDGKKFGKSEKGAVFLDPTLFSPYEFYQYLYRVADADVIKMMKMLTFMPIEEISSIEKKMQEEGYIPNTAQERLARELTLLVHKEEGLLKAEKSSRVMMPGSDSFDEEALLDIAENVPHQELMTSEVIGAKFFEVLAKTSLVTSKGEARRLISGGGAYLNGKKVVEAELLITKEDLLKGELLIVSKGKKNCIVLHLSSC
ncbi:MAG: tyrosine--tRNA ligase [Verrucomicrobia bacterium]|nr:tyrosine--tRNA ligase [Verrucomicrobiota bacterium]